MKFHSNFSYSLLGSTGAVPKEKERDPKENKYPKYMKSSNTSVSKETILKGLEQEEDTAAEEDKLDKKIRNFTVKRAKGATMMKVGDT